MADPPARESVNPFAGAWEGPWEGRNRFWMYPVQGQAWLQIEADGIIAAQLNSSAVGGLSQWQGQMSATGEIDLETLPDGEASGSAHGEAKLVRSGVMQIKLLIGGLGPVPFDAELELTRRQG